MTKRGRILIVDDDVTSTEILCQFLGKEYELETATAGNECLTRLMSFRPQLVLLDVVMPGIGGHEACRRIKLSPMGDSVRVILVSAEQTILDRLRGSDVLADDYRAPEVTGQTAYARQARETLLTMSQDRGRLVGHRG